MSKQSFNIGDKVRLTNDEYSLGYDMGEGEITEIFVAYHEEDGVTINGGEVLQVHFPKLDMTMTLPANKFIAA